MPETTRLVATDLNEPMLRNAAQKFRHDEAVQWQQADACSLPFADESFDAVLCQFGIMFVPDKTLCAREVHRVLKPGGVFLFNVWDSMEHNDLGQIAYETISSFFEKDPPSFYQVPFGYHDQAEIRRVLTQAGFQEVRFEGVTKTAAESQVEDAARGLVHGNPVAVAIAERDPLLLPVITQAVAAALAKHFGGAIIRAPMRATVVLGRA